MIFMAVHIPKFIITGLYKFLIYSLSFLPHNAATQGREIIFLNLYVVVRLVKMTF